MLTVHSSTGIPLQENFSTQSTLELEINFFAVIITQMELSFVQVDSHGLLQFMTSRLDNKWLILKVEVQENLAIVTEFSWSNLTKKIQTWLFQLVGIKMLKCGISDNQVLVDLSMDHIFAEIPLICMTALSLLAHIKITSNSSFGTLDQVSILRTSTGMRAFHQTSLVSSMLPSSKRTQVIL